MAQLAIKNLSKLAPFAGGLEICHTCFNCVLSNEQSEDLSKLRNFKKISAVGKLAILLRKMGEGVGNPQFV